MGGRRNGVAEDLRSDKFRPIDGKRALSLVSRAKRHRAEMRGWRHFRHLPRYSAFDSRACLGFSSKNFPLVARPAVAQPSAVFSYSLTPARFISLKGLLSRRTQQSSEEESKITLAPDNLFHKLSKSPIPELRDRAAIINKYGVCPVCDTREDPSQKRRPVYECPECGYPTHCSEEHYHEGRQAHQEICHILREQNEDDHDLRSGRPMTEFEFPSKRDI